MFSLVKLEGISPKTGLQGAERGIYRRKQKIGTRRIVVDDKEI
jgi:hypothetical protein